MTIRPKDKCPCGSGRKYKKCCMPHSDDDAAQVAEQKYEIICHCAERLSKNLMRLALELGVLEDIEFFHRTFFCGYPPGQFEPEDFRILMEHWLPFNYPVLKKADAEIEVTVAEIISREAAAEMRQDDRRLLAAVKDEPFRFYFVEELGPGPTFRVRDILSDRRREVSDYQASRTIPKGSILLARVASMYGIEFIFGFFPYLLAPIMYPAVKAALEALELEQRTYEYESDRAIAEDSLFREIYLDLLVESSHRPPPKLRNMDDEVLQQIKLTFQLSCSSAEAYQLLCRPGKRHNSWQPQGEITQQTQAGEIQEAAIYFHREGSPTAKLQNISVASLKLTGQTLVAEVNSTKRAARVEKEIQQRLGAAAMLLGKEQVDLKDLPPADPAEIAQQKRRSAELMQLPEVQAQFKQLAREHWEKWFDEPIPMLNNQSPREAARHKEGRDLLEALLAHYEEQDSRAADNIFAPDMDYLRRELHLEGPDSSELI